ncbi:unnamed protein product [Knipowitschia caucasica]|uniref:C3H1-type domain-containing protein n=1 Tax=Knipowitschia caucasica TaxID=637954 RepID=A0AAV2KZW2_KNICA
MAKIFYKFIVQILCNNQGSLDFRTLKEHISQHFTVDEELLRSVLFDDEKIHIQEGTGKISSGEISLDSLIIAKTSLRLCRDKTCKRCDNLHLCRHYVCGNCTFGDKCNHSHSVTSPHNARILAKRELEDLTENQLFQLLLQNDYFMLPPICFNYNGQGGCESKSTCPRLHICLHFLKGDCRFGRFGTCKRAHVVDAHGVKIFKEYKNITNLYTTYRNILFLQNYQRRPAAEASGEKPTPSSKTTASLPKQTAQAGGGDVRCHALKPPGKRADAKK